MKPEEFAAKLTKDAVTVHDAIAKAQKGWTETGLGKIGVYRGDNSMGLQVQGAKIVAVQAADGEWSRWVARPE